MLSVCFAAFTRRDEWRQGIASVGQVGLGLIVSADMLFGKLHISLFPFLVFTNMIIQGKAQEAPISFQLKNNIHSIVHNLQCFLS
jgi:hypothetical protein